MAAAEELPQDLVFVDLETTGGNAAYDRITEVGIVRIRDGELIEEWSSLVNPERPIPPYIEAFTGISDAMVAGAPRFADIATQVRRKLQGAVFVAHNARFDYSFLRSEFLKTEMGFSAKILCTVKLSRRLFPEYIRHNLDAVMERNGLSCSARHRALGDARVLHDLWLKWRRDVPQARLAAAVQTLLGADRLPAHLPAGLADELPEGPGVYRFFGEDDVLLYVGKGNSLRTRVCGHFAVESVKSGNRAFSDKVRRVAWVETAGELGAMLREAQWLKTLKPLHNRRAKSREGSCTLRATGALRTTGTREAAVSPGAAARPIGVVPIGVVPIEVVPIEVVPIEGLDPADLAHCFGVFQSAKDARKALGDIARAQRLCFKVLGIEDGEGSCLAFHMGKCKGACMGKEPLILHNTRLLLALSSLKLKPWPFPGRIALRERDPRGGVAGFARATDIHVVEHWGYLGTARTEEELAALSATDTRPAFDVDVYRILIRYFAGHPRIDWHELKQGENA
jgi:DNA polymerase-3 subunit epsilon